MNKKNRNRKISNDEKFDVYKAASSKCTLRERETLEEFSEAAERGINTATNDFFSRNLENIESLREDFKFECMLKYFDDILQDKFSVKEFENMVRCFAYIRKRTWFRNSNRLQDCIRSHALIQNRYNLVYEESGEVVDFGRHQMDFYDLFSSNLDQMNSEEVMIHKEIVETLRDIPNILRDSGRKWAEVYGRIIELELDGTNVTSAHAKQLGIQQTKVRYRKHEAFKLARSFLIEHFPDLAERYQSLKDKPNKKITIQKLTYDERKNLYKHQESGEMKPRLIRLWKVIDGEGNTKAENEYHFDLSTICG